MIIGLKPRQPLSVSSMECNCGLVRCVCVSLIRIYLHWGLGGPKGICMTVNPLQNFLGPTYLPPALTVAAACGSNGSLKGIKNESHIPSGIGDQRPIWGSILSTLCRSCSSRLQLATPTGQRFAHTELRCSCRHRSATSQQQCFSREVVIHQLKSHLYTYS